MHAPVSRQQHRGGPFGPHMLVMVRGPSRGQGTAGPAASVWKRRPVATSVASGVGGAARPPATLEAGILGAQLRQADVDVGRRSQVLGSGLQRRVGLCHGIHQLQPPDLSAWMRGVFGPWPSALVIVLLGGSMQLLRQRGRHACCAHTAAAKTAPLHMKLPVVCRYNLWLLCCSGSSRAQGAANKSPQNGGELQQHTFMSTSPSAKRLRMWVLMMASIDSAHSPKHRPFSALSILHRPHRLRGSASACQDPGSSPPAQAPLASLVANLCQAL